MDHNQDNDKQAAFHLEGNDIVFDKPKSSDQIALETRESERHEFARDQVKTNRSLTRLTACLVIGAITGSGIGVWQARISQKAADAAKESADSAADASYMACLGAKVARSALIEQQAGSTDAHRFAQSSVYQAVAVTRAQAARIDKQQALTPFLEGHNIFFRFNLKNVGPTDALNVKLKAAAEIAPFKDDPPLVYPQKGFRDSRPTLEPGQLLIDDIPNAGVTVENKDGKDILVDRQFLSDFQAGKTGLILFADISYTDVFAIPHWQHFCRYYNALVIVDGEANSGHHRCVDSNKTDSNQMMPSEAITPPEPGTIPEISCPIPIGYEKRHNQGQSSNNR